jgi:hypothetical protein
MTGSGRINVSPVRGPPMKPRPRGNGSGRFSVVQSDMGGWVRVYADPAAEPPDDLPVYLSHTLAEWFRQRPHLRLRCVVPVCKDGNTVELHAWFDVHVLPATPVGPKPADKGQG